jgi:DNA-binding SARP family transcriptional activator
MASIHLTTLGALRARTGDGLAADWLTRRPRLVALAVYCGLEGRDGWLAPDTLTTLFWPEAEGRRSGRLLSQLFYEAAGEAGFRLDERKRGAGIRLVPGAVQCDAAELLFGEVDAAWVAEHVAGDLLPGLAVPGSQALDDWLAAARTRVRQRAVSLLLAGAAAEPDRAVAYARHALRLEPWNADAATSLIRALGRAGAAPDAYREFQSFRAYLQAELDLDPPPAVTIEVLRVCGPGQPATPAEPGVPEAGDVAPHVPDAAPPPRVTRHPVRRATAAAALTLAATAAAVLLWLRPPAASAGGPEVWAADLAVTAAAADGDAAWNAVVAPELMTRLSRRGMRVLVAPERGGQAPFALAGSVRAADGAVAGTVRLLDTRTGALVGAWDVTARADGLGDVATAVADSIRTSMGRASALAAWHGSGRPAAAVQALADAHAEFEAATAAIRQGAAALGDSRLAVADTLALAAAALAPGWAEPHLLRAAALEHRALRAMAAGNPAASGQALGAAVAAADAAVRLDGGVAALERRGTLHYLAWRLDVPVAGDAWQAAHADLEAAGRSPEATSHSWVMLSSLHAAAGRHNDAYAAALEAMRRDVFGARSEQVLARLFMSAFHAGRDGEARAWCDEAARRSPGKWHVAQCQLMSLAFRADVSAATIAGTSPDLQREAPAVATATRPLLELLRAAVLASNGFDADARAVLHRAADAAQVHPEGAYYAAKAYAQLGELRHAQELLAGYIREGPGGRATVMHDRWFEPLR